MNAILIQAGSEMMKTGTVEQVINNGSMSVYKGVDKEGSTFITVDAPANRIILITTLSSSDSTILIDAISPTTTSLRRQSETATGAPAAPPSALGRVARAIGRLLWPHRAARPGLLT